MRRRFRDWPLVQSVVVLVGVVFLLVACLPSVKEIWHELSAGLGAALVSVGVVALVYEVRGRVQMLDEFEQMLSRFLGKRSVEAAGIVRVTCSFSDLPLLFDAAEPPTDVCLAGMDLRRFFAVNDAALNAAIGAGGCKSLRILLQGADSHFAQAMSQLQGEDRIHTMRANQAQLLNDLRARVRARPAIGSLVEVRRSARPLLGGLAIVTFVGSPARFCTLARYSPYLGLPFNEESPTFDVSGPESPLFGVLVKHFENLWKGAKPVDLG